MRNIRPSSKEGGVPNCFATLNEKIYIFGRLGGRQLFAIFEAFDNGLDGVSDMGRLRVNGPGPVRTCRKARKGGNPQATTTARKLPSCTTIVGQFLWYGF
jgi:hypothetical protein